MMIAEDTLLAALPALEAILTPNGLEYPSMDVVTARGEPVAPPTIISEHFLLRVFVYDEEMGFWLYPREGVSDFTARLRSELQDFVAESGFGWGELRP